jgi:hypothetical protein
MDISTSVAREKIDLLVRLREGETPGMQDNDLQQLLRFRQTGY